MRNDPAYLQKVFQCDISELDMDLAYEVFDILAFKETFASTDGTAEELRDPHVMTGVYNTVYTLWAEAYYIAVLEKLGAVDRFDDVVVIKQAYMPSVKTLLTPASTKSGV